jgi:HD-like signal output (HDOD) protein
MTATRSGVQVPDGGDGGASGPGLLGATLGNYRISRLLGQGGMGSVYLAEHVLIGRQVAIKVLDPQIAGHPDVVSRFFVEARAVNEIRHPNIVDVTDLGTHAGQPFIVMEYLAGETLEARLERAGRLSDEETVRIARQVASALGAAHERGLVHRDLKPANIMLRDHPDYPDFVKVLDFGIAKLLGATGAPVAHHTEVGTLLGTPAYMSPEQCLGDMQLDHRSDVYSLGVILFLMLAGRLPFDHNATGRLILAHVHQPAPAVTELRPDVTPALAALVARALAKRPGDRFGSMKEMRAALEQALGGVAFPRSLTPVAGNAAVGSALPAPTARLGRNATPAPAATAFETPTVTTARRTPVALPTPGATLAARLEEAVIDRLARGELQLPPLPTSHARCLEILRDPSFSFAAVAAQLKQDGRLGSHVLRRSNSDGVPGRGVAITPEQAIARLGLHGMRAAIIEQAARRVIDTRDERMEEELRRPWQHALAGAIVAERLVRASGQEDLVSDAYVATLLRDLGVPLVAGLTFELEWELAGRRPGRTVATDVWLAIVRAHQRKAGRMLAEHWGLSDALARTLEGDGKLAPDGGWSLANVAATAGALADKEGFYLRRAHLPDAEAAAKAGTAALGLGDLVLRRALDRLKEAVRLRE